MAFRKSLAFIKSGKGNAAKQRWIEEVGVYYYYCLVLSDFNPVVADQIFDSPAHVIAEAFVSKIVYNTHE